MPKRRKIDKHKLPPILKHYNEYMAIRFSPTTRDNRLYSLLRLHEFMQCGRGKSIEQLNRADVEAYMANLTLRKEKGEIKQRMVKTEATIIKMFARWLTREEILDSRELYKIEEDLRELPGETGEDNRVALSDEEERRIYEKLVDILLQMIIWVGLNFGLRLQEYCKLCVRHLELDRDIPRLKIELSKGHIKKTRYIPLFPSQVSQFKKWLEFRASLNLHHDFLLYNPRNPSVGLTRNTLSWLFHRMSEITGVHLYAHKLRYTYAVKLWKHGVDLWLIKEALGHEKIETTASYLKIRIEDYFNKFIAMAKGLFH